MSTSRTRTYFAPGRSFMAGLRNLALLLGLLIAHAGVQAEIRAGAGASDITPPAGTPSAGYGARQGRGMTGTHDPLLATALILDNGDKMIVFVGVDHLGYDSLMVNEVIAAVSADPGMERLEVYLGSSHTHAGGGAYMDIPIIGESLAGKYDPSARQVYIDGAIRAIREAVANLQPAKVGIGYGAAPGLNAYRGDWPPNVSTLPDLAVIKATRADGSPLAVMFNYAAHATVLSAGNMEFSADFVGYARRHATALIGGGVQAVYFNGAQGDVSPRAPGAEDRFERARLMGEALAEEVKRIWDDTQASDSLQIDTMKESYLLEVKATSQGMMLPIEPRPTEIGAIVFNATHAFVTIPGELSCIYDADIKRFGGWLGFEHVSILGLTNDAHGYIITPESWRHQTYESTVSFGGELYGDTVRAKVYALLHGLEPGGAYHEQRAQRSSILSVPVELD